MFQGPRYTLHLTLGYEAATLSIDFRLGALAPVQWDAWMFLVNFDLPFRLWSIRLYCIHCVQSEEPMITVYQIIEPDLKSEPFAEIAQRAYNQFKSLRRQRGSARVLDLYAAVDHSAKFDPEQLTYKKIYPPQSQVAPSR